jgi:hypothetical protein
MEPATNKHRETNMTIPSAILPAIALFKQSEIAYNADQKDVWRSLRSTARKILTKSGCSRVGSGDYRVVYTLPDSPNVIKIARNPLGIEENLAAVNNWHKAERLNVNSRLAKLVEHEPNGWWILQEHVSETTPSSVATLKYELREAGLVINEVNRDSIGMRNGSAVLLDYGGV